MNHQLDIQSNRSAQKYSRKEQGARVLWACVWPVFRISPRPCFAFRRWMLRCFGARVGNRVHVYPSVTIYFPWNLTIDDDSVIGERAIVYNLGKCYIGKRVTISQGAHLCGGSHDYTDPTMPLLKSFIHIDDDAWVCADAFVGPGVRVYEGAVVAARAVATRDVESWVVVAGNPAERIKSRRLRDPDTER